MVAAHIRSGLRLASNVGADPSGEQLFSLIWEALADLLGTATAAVLVRRAARRGAGVSPELAELEISIGGLEYRYTVPRAWTEGAGETPTGLRTLIGELLPLLLELTGRIAIHRLERIPELRVRRLLAPRPGERQP
jgi:hypothetical protein